MNDHHPPLDQDAATAHLDRGWDLLSKGDFAGARVSADHILRTGGESPEGTCLLGAISAAEGDPEEALELFQQAMDLEPAYLEPVLLAADLCVHAMDDLDLGLRFCADAEALGLGVGDSVTVKLLTAEAHLALGHKARALAAVQQLPRPPFEDPTHHLQLGRLLMDLGELVRAEEVLSEALSHEDTRAEAHYFTGVALDRGGDVIAARRHLARSLELERGTRPAYPPLEDGEFGALVEQALERLHPGGRDQYRGAPVTVFEHPPVELVAEGFDPRCPAFASGGVEAGTEEGRVTHLFIYRRNVERVGPAWDVMVDLLQQALEQELEELLHTGGG